MYGDRNPYKNVLSSLRVLFVDDMPEMRQLAESFLRFTGATVTFASSGAEALELLSENTDVVLMDIKMPNMSGVLTAEKMRTQGFLGVIIAVSAAHTSDPGMDYPKPTFDGFVEKPYEFKTLIKAILAGFERAR